MKVKREIATSVVLLGSALLLTGCIDAPGPSNHRAALKGKTEVFTATSDYQVACREILHIIRRDLYETLVFHEIWTDIAEAEIYGIFTATDAARGPDFTVWIENQDHGSCQVTVTGANTFWRTRAAQCVEKALATLNARKQ